MKQIPPELDRITDVVLAYHPKPKTKAANRRARAKTIVCMCGHSRGDHGGMGPSRGRKVFSACGLCDCDQWRPSKRESKG